MAKWEGRVGLWATVVQGEGEETEREGGTRQVSGQASALDEAGREEVDPGHPSRTSLPSLLALG